MHTQYFTYALEVEKTGSITQAAENLFMSQPTLSKAIKDLEGSLGFPVFKRSSRGVVPTRKGEEFLLHAKKIVAQIERMEFALQTQDTSHQMFSLAIPRVSYIAQAAAQYVRTLDDGRNMEIDILEGSAMRIIDAVAQGRSVLGILRYHVQDEEYFMRSLSEKGLQYEPFWQGDLLVLMSKNHPLAQKELLEAQDLQGFVEINSGDEEVPYIRTSEAEAAVGLQPSDRRILVYGRAMQLDLLQMIPDAYSRASAQPEEVLKRYDLVQRHCRQRLQFKDVLIFRSGYRFSKLDRAFIDLLCLQRNAVAYGD